MKKQYMTWLEGPEMIRGPLELALTVRDMEPGRHKYRAHNVMAVVSPHSMPEADVLWVRRANGVLLSEPWSIKVTKDLGDFLPGTPYSGVVD